jgi:uncharacterized protein YndB with AHSA1/START domain
MTSDAVTADMRGTSIGVLAIRRSIYIPAPPERVWREFESSERFAGWFGVLVREHDSEGSERTMGHRVLRYEPGAGGWAEMEVEVDGVMRRFGGRIMVFDAPQELTFEDRWLAAPPGGEEPALITFLLTPVLEGTAVELIAHGFEGMGERGAELHRGHQAGWSMRQLEALRRAVEAG